MKIRSGIALAILAGHACAAGRSTLDEMPAPVRSTFIHAFLEDDDPNQYNEVFLEPAMIDKLPGAIVTLRANDGNKIQEGQFRFFLPGNDAKFCNGAERVMQRAVDGKIVGDNPWRVALPVRWDEKRTPRRSYAEGASPVDIIGTELCIAHFATFADDLRQRAAALMAEQSRKSEERSAAKQARHDADVNDLRACLRDQEANARASESLESRTGELNSITDRLDIARAGLEIQRKIIESYEASASSRNAFQRQVQAYNASAADHGRKMKSHARVLERHQIDRDRFDATCGGERKFVDTAVHEVCRTNDSTFCAEAKSRR